MAKTVLITGASSGIGKATVIKAYLYADLIILLAMRDRFGIMRVQEDECNRSLNDIDPLRKRAQAES